MSTQTFNRSPTVEDHARLADVIRLFMSEAIGPDAVDKIYFRNDVDHDGDDILRVTIVLNEEPARHAKKFVGLIGHVRSHMGDFDHFPILSFVSKTDADEMRIEAA